MIELSQDECTELEQRTVARLHKIFTDPSGNVEVAGLIAQIAARATIITIRKYEKMKAEPQGLSQTAE